MAEILLGYGVDFNLQNKFGKVRGEGRRERREGEKREKWQRFCLVMVLILIFKIILER